MNPSHRLAWIDALKGIGIIIVAIGHHPAVWAYSESLGRVIFSVSMPLFFFITGLTLDHGMSARALAMRALSCLIPYFALSLASIPMIFHLHPQTALLDIVLGVVYATGHTIFTVPLWFLPCLAVALSLLFVLDKIELQLAGPARYQSAITQLVLFVALQAAWQFAISLDHHLERRIGWGNFSTSGAPWSAEVALVGASFVILGRLFTRHVGNTPWMKRPQWGSAFLISAAFIATNLLLHPTVDLNWRYDKPLVLSALIAAAGIMAAVTIAISIRSSAVTSVLRWLGTTTILILWLHATLEKTAFNALDGRIGSLSALIISVLIALLVPAAISSALKKLPWLHGFIAPGPYLKRFLADKPATRVGVKQVRAE
ncbi:MAG: acyltransferase family protein [Cytophagales bacterium]|nr:acyltransferase family protein [Rhizobacter sp.]